MGLYDILTSGKGIDYENQYSLSQQKAITYIPLATSILSIIGSLVICYIILSDYKRKLGKVKQRLILCMSILDVICSVWFGLWALPIPIGTPGVYGAHGNQHTCSAQGFFIQWQISVPMYNGALSVYYYLVVVRKKKNEEIAKKHEPWMHFICNAYPFISGIAAIFIDGGLYNYDSIGCWIAPYPRGCKHDKDLTCTRGNLAYIFQWLFAGVEEASAALIVVYCMWFVYKEVKMAEETMKKRYSFRRGSISDSRSLAETSRNTLYQAISYVFAVVATRLWSFVVVMNDEFGGANPFWVVILQQFWFPLQGFWNALIYIHPYYKKIRQYYCGAPWYWCVKEAVINAPTDDDMRRRRDSGDSFRPRRRRSTPETTRHSRRSSSSTFSALRNSFSWKILLVPNGSDKRRSASISQLSESGAERDVAQKDDPVQKKDEDEWYDDSQEAATSEGDLTGKTKFSCTSSEMINTSSVDESSLMTPEKKTENKKRRKTVTFLELPKNNKNDGKEPHEIRVNFISNHTDDCDEPVEESEPSPSSEGCLSQAASSSTDAQNRNLDEDHEDIGVFEDEYNLACELDDLESAQIKADKDPQTNAPQNIGSDCIDVHNKTMDENDDDIGEFEDEHILRHQLGDLALALAQNKADSAPDNEEL